MSRRYQLLQRRFGNERPGLQLVGVEDAAIPVSDLRADVLAQERKELPITEEFTMLFVERGVDTAEDIAAYLGLETTHVIEAAASQVSENNLRRRSGGQQLALTALGTEVVRNASTVRPSFKNLPIKFDRLIWEPADYLANSLISRRRAAELGYTLLPAERKARIGLADFTPAKLNSLLRSGNLKSLQVLQIHKVSTKKNLYLPVHLLVYADKSGGEIELAVCIDEELSDAHGLALDRNEIVKSLRMSVGEARPRPQLDSTLESQRTTMSPAQVLSDPIGDSLPDDSRAATGLVRSVNVFEHPDLLSEALEKARSRILILSPSLRHAVVNADFIARVESRLRRGVEVAIAHERGVDDSASDVEAARSLDSLSAKYQKFSYARASSALVNTLIFDDVWVSTSFDWLSFKGGPERTYRMEEGTLVGILSRVNSVYSEYRQKVFDQTRK